MGQLGRKSVVVHNGYIEVVGGHVMEGGKRQAGYKGPLKKKKGIKKNSLISKPGWLNRRAGQPFQSYYM